MNLQSKFHVGQRIRFVRTYPMNPEFEYLVGREATITRIFPCEQYMTDFLHSNGCFVRCEAYGMEEAYDGAKRSSWASMAGIWQPHLKDFRFKYGRLFPKVR